MKRITLVVLMALATIVAVRSPASADSAVYEGATLVCHLPQACLITLPQGGVSSTWFPVCTGDLLNGPFRCEGFIGGLDPGAGIVFVYPNTGCFVYRPTGELAYASTGTIVVHQVGTLATLMATCPANHL